MDLPIPSNPKYVFDQRFKEKQTNRPKKQIGNTFIYQLMI